MSDPTAAGRAAFRVLRGGFVALPVPLGLLVAAGTPGLLGLLVRAYHRPFGGTR